VATFDINDKYSATYSYHRSAEAWVAKGELFRGSKPTGITFRGVGKTLQAAVNAAHTEALRMCPSE
jgi:hypothetical protein